MDAAMDDKDPVATALHCVQYLSEDEVQQYAAFLHKEGYKDVGSLRQVLTRPSEWHRVRLPLRLKCAVEVKLAGRIFADGTTREEPGYASASINAALTTA